MNQRVISLLGLIVFVGIGYLFSVNRRAIQWSTVLWGIGLQLILAVFILKTTLGLTMFQFLGDLLKQLLDFSDEGAKFVFLIYLPNLTMKELRLSVPMPCVAFPI